MAKSKSRSKSKTQAQPAPSAAEPAAKPEAAVAAESTRPAAKPAGGRLRIVWPHVSTVVSATILIGAEVFGAAFAASWAIATLFGFGFLGARILDVVLMLCGLAVMVQFVRSAHLIEPFTARE